MKTNKLGGLGVPKTELKVHDLSSLYAKILRNQVSECVKVPRFELEFVVRQFLNTLAEKVVDNTCGKDRLEVGFFVHFELCAVWVEMDAQTGDSKERFASCPVSALEVLLLLSSPDDDLACEGQIFIKPSPPDAAAISHDVDLLVPKAFFLADWSNLEDRRVCVAADDLERVDRLLAHFVSCEERANSRSISGEVVAFSSLEFPRVDFLNFGEAVLGKLVLAVVHSMEVRLRCIDSCDDLLGVRDGLGEEGFGDCF